MADQSYEEQLKAANAQVYSHSLELARLTKSLEQANALQENLLHFISHEIKGFLTKGQNAFAEIVEGDYGTIPEPVRELSKGALIEMRKGVDTVMDILDASNLKKGTVTFKKEPFDIKTGVETVVSDMKAIAEAKGLTLSLSIGDGDYSYVGDEQKFRRHVVRNLIDNSIRYTQTGSIQVSLEREGSTIRFKVVDTGVGISQEDMGRLFTEGGHGKESIKVNVDSTGYGLFIAKQVTEAHGGKVWANSDGPGKGSTFTVELPTG